MTPPETEAIPDDAVLAERVVLATPKADGEAEAELCRRFGPRIRLYGLRHLRDDAAAADLVQHVLLTMIERLRAGVLREPERLASFVFGICRMAVLDLRRGHTRRERLLEMYGEVLRPPESPPLDLDRERLTRCLESLQERERTVLMLTFYEDMPAEMLARELALSPGNVRVIRHRGLAHLRHCLDGGTG